MRETPFRFQRIKSAKSIYQGQISPYNRENREDVKIMETEKERKDTQKAMLYDLRLLIKGSDKEQYTKEELLDLLDTIAAAKDQE